MVIKSRKNLINGTSTRDDSGEREQSNIRKDEGFLRLQTATDLSGLRLSNSYEFDQHKCSKRNRKTERRFGRKRFTLQDILTDSFGGSLDLSVRPCRKHFDLHRGEAKQKASYSLELLRGFLGGLGSPCRGNFGSSQSSTTPFTLLSSFFSFQGFCLCGCMCWTSDDSCFFGKFDCFEY